MFTYSVTFSLDENDFPESFSFILRSRKPLSNSEIAIRGKRALKRWGFSPRQFESCVYLGYLK